jgi:hypothetical protein
MAGILKENDNALIDRAPITPPDLKVITDRPNLRRNMKAIRGNWIVVEILVLLVGSGLMLSAVLGMIIQMDEDMIALESTAHLIGSGRPQR